MLMNAYWAMEPMALARLQAAMRSGDVRLGRTPLSESRSSADLTLADLHMMEELLPPPMGSEPRAARISDRTPADDLPMVIEAGVATIVIGGVMLKRPGWFSSLFGMAATVLIRAAVRAAVADPDVGAILLQVDSPGGVADGIEELADEIHAANKIKPVVAQVDGMAASAAYWAASQCSAIFAHKLDTIGCIGARILFFDQHEAFEQMGVEAVAIDSAPEDRPFKSMGAPGTELTEQHRAEIQRIIDQMGDAFKAAVVRGRESMSAQEVDGVADGRVWHAADALRLRLIDGIQTIEQTVAALRGQVAEKAAGRDRMARARVARMERG